MKVAVTAASGNLGTEIIKTLVNEVGSQNVIGIARSPEKAPYLGVEIRKGEYNNKLDFDESDYDFWKLQYKLKWELEVNSDKKMEPLFMALTNAFQKLNYESPEMEAQLIILFIDGLGSSVLKGSSLNPIEMIQFLLKKYNI